MLETLLGVPSIDMHKFCSLDHYKVQIKYNPLKVSFKYNFKTGHHMGIFHYLFLMSPNVLTSKVKVQLISKTEVINLDTLNQAVNEDFIFLKNLERFCLDHASKKQSGERVINQYLKTLDLTNLVYFLKDKLSIEECNEFLSYFKNSTCEVKL